VIIRPRNILFKCKGNICRSPAAEIILKNLYPDMIVFSCATTNNTIGQTIHPDMVTALRTCHYEVPDPKRPVVAQDWIIEYLPLFDEIHDLHAEGISDPFLTGNHMKTVLEIMEYIRDIILEDDE
jgi:hypothetical protein